MTLNDRNAVPNHVDPVAFSETCCVEVHEGKTHTITGKMIAPGM